MRNQLEKRLIERVAQSVSSKKNKGNTCPKITRKQNALAKRSAEIVKTKASGRIIRQELSRQQNRTTVYYDVHFQYVIRQAESLHMEEEIERRRAKFYKEALIEDIEIVPVSEQRDDDVVPEVDQTVDAERISYHYDRLKAVQYAERWWNDYNPAYKKFEVDCTNYISQCLHAGGAPMTGQPNRSKGWWMSHNNWSFSWSVAHALRLYLTRSQTGLRAKEVERPEQLLLGDVICYDFQGDGRFDHNTIVTGIDAEGMPLVNAHTYNSRMRNWAYEDSSAYTPNIKYKFLTIVDG